MSSADAIPSVHNRRSHSRWSHVRRSHVRRSHVRRGRALRRVALSLARSVGGAVLKRVPENFARAVERHKTRHPATFNEKTLYKMAQDRRPILTLFADKLAVRDYVAEHVGEHVLAKLYATAPEAAQIDWTTLPREFVAKVTHGSGGVIVVSESADRRTQIPTDLKNLGWSRFLIHPDSVDIEKLIDVMNTWLTMSFSQHKLLAIREWAYRDVPHRLIVEEYVTTETPLPPQLLCTCFHGRVEEIIIDGGGISFTQGTTHRFLRSEFESARTHLAVSVDSWNEVLRMSAALAAAVDMVRVDWRVTNRGFIFGELTNYPAAGRLGLVGNPLHPPHELDALLGALWNQPSEY